MIRRIIRPTKTWKPCRPVRPKNVDGEGAVARVEADAVVLDDLRQQERQAEQEREHQPACRPVRLPRLIDCVAQCTVKLEVTRMQVLTSAMYHGRM